ncbi:MAG TPA: SAM-dependent chlorinase/fluorinase [Steroidobacteraceae bacterium]|nr:SAM-dependent chlorinase/fluorinase [Steroidobacteraceae bacterium]
MSAFEACGVITLTTDFGQEGPFVATMKGRILSRFADARIIDVTHEIVVHWPVEAGFWLARSYPYFPAGTVHVAVVDPGVGTERDIVAVHAESHVFLAPDNGLLAPVLGRVQGARAFRLTARHLERFDLGRPSATFHGRDIFAPLAAELAAGRCQPGDLGRETDDLAIGWTDEAEQGPGGIRGVVITIDHFGNLITNIDEDLLAKIANPVVRAGNRAIPLRRTYGEMKPGEYLALINSFGVLEIARAEQSAAEGLGLGRGAPVSVTSQ